MTFVRNLWYLVAWSQEIGKNLLARRILHGPTLFFRTTDGEIAAIEEHCPHHLAPLWP